MNYTCIEKNNYRFHYMKTNKFKTILMSLNFKQKIEEHLITEREILSGLLSNSSKDYPTLRDMILKKEDLYQLNYGCSTVTSGNYIIFKSFVKFISEKYTEDGMNEASIRFLLDSIMKPNVDGDSFKKDIFDLEKNNYLEYLEGKDDNPNNYATTKFNKLFGEGTPLVFDHNGDIEVLKKIDEKTIYQSYLDMINNSTVDVFFVGNMEIEEVTSIIDEYFSSRNSKQEKSTHYVTINDYELKEKIDKNNFKQSKLRMGFSIPNITDFERQYVLPIYNFILGGDADSLLFKNVREKNSLCYDISSSVISVYSAIRISAGIAAKSYDKAISIIKEMIECMKNGEFDEEELVKVKLNYKTSFKEIMDSPGSIASILESHEYLGYDFPDERIEKINSVTKDMVVELAKKVELKVIYFLEGND